MIRNLLFPRRCPGCNELLSENEIDKGFCKECRSLIKRAEGHVCEKCGRLLITPGGTLCDECRSRPHSFDEARSLYIYDEPLKSAMYRFKYSNMRGYIESFMDEGYHRIAPWIEHIVPDVIVPVPMFKAKERKRGYNQADVIGKALSKRSGIPFKKDLIIRAKNTLPQKGLSPEERRNNLKNAFKTGASVVQLSRILIVDDILTTGVTADMMSSLLKEAGTEKVFCFSICTGRAVESPEE